MEIEAPVAPPQDEPVPMEVDQPEMPVLAKEESPLPAVEPLVAEPPANTPQKAVSDEPSEELHLTVNYKSPPTFEAREDRPSFTSMEPIEAAEPPPAARPVPPISREMPPSPPPIA